ncbi:MAG: hypothetical protein E4H14_06755 [Candidatus Thorarchaeota archaeon]|nr:MAG: hypothetical protein E4H14_06755 [Candidatus Thorarchaeota archaeon]
MSDTTNPFEGFQVGDLIYNTAHREYLTITRLVQETGPYAVESPYIMGTYVHLTDEGLEESDQVGYVLIETSRLVVFRDIHNLVLSENLRHDRKLKYIEALGRLIKTRP